jgi:hypothetical protein
MGYHETQTTYPYVETCDNNADGYWGRDYWNNLIEPYNTAIRHHRMPGAEIRDYEGDVANFRVGLYFTNVSYPQNENIVGHYFVYGDRTFERTILAKGIFIPLDIDEEGSPVKYSFNAYDSLRAQDYTWPATDGLGVRSNEFAFISSETLFKNKSFDGGYVKFEKLYRRDPDAGTFTTRNKSDIPFDVKNGYDANLTSIIYYQKYVSYDLLSSADINHNIQNNLFIDKTYQGAIEGNSAYEYLKECIFINNSVSMPLQVLKLESGSGVIGPSGL